MLPNFPATAVRTDLDPIIITAPTHRSGTTLLQRLLCSSRSALIYGEQCAHDLEFFINLYVFKVQEYTYQNQRFTQVHDAVLDGSVNEWILDLMPNVEGYLDALAHSALSGIMFCREEALRYQRPVWGFKYPGWRPAFIGLLKAVLPRARFIFIQRDLVDCLKSAKSQNMIPSLQETRAFVQAWAEGVACIASLSDDPAVLSLKYNALVSAPAATLERLSEFTGLADLDATILTHKVNTWKGDEYVMQKPDGYQIPAELSESEMQIVNEMLSQSRNQHSLASAARAA